ncbi:hypothetical protein HGRIS_008506 [Hohenbuehelia grisea]|uniref:CENP-V/GFA domain-containing protein n=1 Tax=Hohenbuehelia grisea TaxID=104357 RepID=A0ABR3J857_9AGAR
MNTVRSGGCFCGSVKYAVSGEPVLSAYCHCTLCQRLNASPFMQTIHFESSAFSWDDKPTCASSLESFEVTTKPWKQRWRCKNCGTNVASHNSKTNRWSIWGATLDRDDDGKILDWDALKPTSHMFYGTRMLDVQDDLPKWDGYENKSKRLD